MACKVHKLKFEKIENGVRRYCTNEGCKFSVTERSSNYSTKSLLDDVRDEVTGKQMWKKGWVKRDKK